MVPASVPTDSSKSAARRHSNAVSALKTNWGWFAKGGSVVGASAGAVDVMLVLFDGVTVGPVLFIGIVGAADGPVTFAVIFEGGDTTGTVLFTFDDVVAFVGEDSGAVLLSVLFRYSTGARRQISFVLTFVEMASHCWKVCDGNPERGNDRPATSSNLLVIKRPSIHTRQL